MRVSDSGVGIEDIERARMPLFTSKPECDRSGMGFTVMESFMDTLLIEKARQGDRAALERLTAENTGLIWSAVKKFSGRGTDKEDLFQIGAIGLIKAINKFDTSFNVEFSTYAVPMIMGEIRRFLRDDGLIKVSRGLKETAVKAMAAATPFIKQWVTAQTICF